MTNQLGLFGDEPEVKKTARRSRSRARLPESGELLRRMQALEERFDRVEQVLHQIHELMAARKVVKDRYTVKEVAAIVGKSKYTVREWCREQRILADKAMCGRGSELSWLISHEELTRLQNEGLRPKPDHFQMVKTVGQ